MCTALIDRPTERDGERETGGGGGWQATPLWVSAPLSALLGKPSRR